MASDFLGAGAGRIRRCGWSEHAGCVRVWPEDCNAGPNYFGVPGGLGRRTLAEERRLKAGGRLKA